MFKSQCPRVEFHGVAAANLAMECELQLHRVGDLYFFTLYYCVSKYTGFVVYSMNKTGSRQDKCSKLG